MRDAYWKEKDLAKAIELGIEIIELGEEAEDLDVRSAVKTAAYNLASFTWRGWDEPDLPITDSQAELGRDMAQVNVEYAHELEKGDLALSRAYWMLGAHNLTAGLRPEAQDAFTRAATYGARADSPADRYLAEAFIGLTELAGDAGAAGGALIQKAFASLRSLPDGEGFIAQVETAARVLGVTIP